MKDFFSKLLGFGKQPTKVTLLTEKQTAKRAAYFSAVEAKVLSKTKAVVKFATQDMTLANGTIIAYDPETKLATMMVGEIPCSLPAGDYDMADGSKLRVENAAPAVAEIIDEVMTEMAAEPETQKMASYPLPDGRMIEVGAEGEPVFIDGQPAPAGEYVTADGNVYVVIEGGVLGQALSKLVAESLQTVLTENEQLSTQNAQLQANFKKVETELKTATAKLAALTDPKNVESNKGNGDQNTPENFSQIGDSIRRARAAVEKTKTSK